MKEKIFKLIYDYLKSNRMIDQEYIDKVIEIVVNDESLHDYVKETKYITDKEMNKHNGKGWTVQIADASKLMDLAYNHETHTIKVYTDNIPKIYDICYNKMDFDNPKSAFFSIYTQRILHEIEHGNQERIINEEDNLEAKILCACRPRVNISNEYSANKKVEEVAKILFRTALYYANYEYSPMERMAEISSYKKMKSIISLDKIDLSNTTQYFNEMILKKLIEAYDDSYLSPTIRYIKILWQYDKENPLAKFDWYSEDEEECLRKSVELYSFEKRINWGLPVEKEKKVRLQHQLIKVKN